MSEKKGIFGFFKGRGRTPVLSEEEKAQREYALQQEKGTQDEEHQAARNNPLERVMTIRTRPDGADIETTTEHFAQRLGKHLDRAFKGSIEYRWSHKDKCVRIAWQGPPAPTRRARSAKTPRKKS